ncbi:MAG: adenylyltransferase/cytidyltransferase family protein [Bacteroidales bacterium]|nr:adenylyltransferase/cytidyltransferase family protein [Bacteroidales bacterium]MDD3151452.1 adenylyltransferase/cytidyltransferase family protein [Bacteroidales bacterium]MDD3914413.1 adenylyltransferase/cytidyltransferase family protein [Bacteroidales bacterium]MDD4634594.1 adenylyltransferase/cytidyltransferase family protein [Bacteroidales bacterium]
MNKKVFVSGCYDMLHSGHVAFFEEAATYGDLYVGLGSDKTIYQLKGRRTVNSEQERLYMVKALRCVKDAWINKGCDLLDFVDEIKKLKPDIFFVNSDGNSILKQELCKELGIQYIVSQRVPHSGLPIRSTTGLRTQCRIPYRIDLAGGWLDQPYVSKYYPGAVITINIEPDYEFNYRSGLSTSSRKAAIEMWGNILPTDNLEKLAKMVFYYENKPGTKFISGSQDAIGIVFPGLNKLQYDNEYWPFHIESVLNDGILDFIEQRLYLIQLFPRNQEFDVLANTNINKANAHDLSVAADNCWNAIINKDAVAWGKASVDSFNAQIKMFPNMVSDEVLTCLEQYKDKALGWKLCGAGGGGYLVLISEIPVENAIKIHIRRP